jgi:hypothetical protein
MLPSEGAAKPDRSASLYDSAAVLHILFGYTVILPALLCSPR